VDATNRQETGADLWLDEEQQATWRVVVQLFTKLPATLESDLQRKAALTLYEYVVLALLSESEDRTLQMSELAVGTNSSLSRLSHVVSRLEKRGWVTRQVCPHDGRAAHAILTESGLAKVVDAAPDHVRAVRELVVDAITPTQLRQLGTAAAKIGQRIQEWNATGSATANRLSSGHAGGSHIAYPSTSDGVARPLQRIRE
jgi:DNA-binding MarR family transcriptional regulator